MNIYKWLRVFICSAIFLGQLSFGAIYPVPNYHVPLPALRGLPYLDDGLEDVGRYVEIINHWRQNGHISADTKEFLSQKLLGAIELFRPQIEQQPNFLACEKYWNQLQREILKLINKDVVGIPLMHMVGLKLVLLKDISHLSTKENSDYFLQTRKNRMHDVILEETGALIRSITRHSYLSIVHLLEHSLEDARKDIQVNMYETIPFCNNKGVFGLNAFFYAFFNNVLIHRYPAAADSIIHGQRWNTYQSYFDMLHYQKNSSLSLHIPESFFSSILFASHDRAHTERYKRTFTRSEQSFLFQYYLFLDQNLLESDMLAKLIVLFFTCHELDRASSPSEIISRATNVFMDEYQYAGCCTTEKERKENAH